MNKSNDPTDAIHEYNEISELAVYTGISSIVIADEITSQKNRSIPGICKLPEGNLAQQNLQMFKKGYVIREALI